VSYLNPIRVRFAGDLRADVRAIKNRDRFDRNDFTLRFAWAGF